VLAVARKASTNVSRALAVLTPVLSGNASDFGCGPDGLLRHPAPGMVRSHTWDERRHRDSAERSSRVIDETLLNILVCPADRGPLLLVGDVLYNPRMRRAYRIDDGIPVLLVDEAIEVGDDEHARLMTRVNPQ
jgi:uncharacterized protein